MSVLASIFKRKRSFNPEDVSIKEQFYSICSRLGSALSKDDSILMLTSLTQTQSVSNASAYLALAFSEQQKKVLIVDANLREPSLHHLFKVDNSFGLKNLLLNWESIYEDRTIKITDYLYCVPAGEGHYEPSSLFTLDKAPAFFTGWKESYDIILLHTSNYLDTPDAQIIANHCDAAVLVIQEGRDKLEKVINIKKQLKISKHELYGTFIIS